ncbi:hypothetical protein NPIL_173491, partial [Nephila pilipes]
SGDNFGSGSALIGSLDQENIYRPHEEWEGVIKVERGFIMGPRSERKPMLMGLSEELEELGKSGTQKGFQSIMGGSGRGTRFQ